MKDCYSIMSNVGSFIRTVDFDVVSLTRGEVACIGGSVTAN